jgi:Icc protein
LVLFLTDLHFRGEPGVDHRGRDPDARLQLVLAAWRQSGRHADLVVLGGDNSDDGSAESYQRLAALLADLDAPILAVPGNHDLVDHQQEVFGETTLVEVGEWRVLGWNTAVPGQIHGTLNADALAQRLDELDRRPTLLVQHHPLGRFSTHQYFWLPETDAEAAVLAERPHVRAVLSGHLHEGFHLSGDGWTVLGGPSTFTPFRHCGDTFESGIGGPTGGRAVELFDDGSFASWLVVD